MAHVRAAAAGEGAIEGFASKNDETRAAFGLRATVQDTPSVQECGVGFTQMYM